MNQKKNIPTFDRMSTRSALDVILSGDSVCGQQLSIPAENVQKFTKQQRSSLEVSGKKKTSFYISPNTHHELKIYCADKDIMMSTFIEQAISEKLHKE